MLEPLGAITSGSQFLEPDGKINHGYIIYIIYIYIYTMFIIHI